MKKAYTNLKISVVCCLDFIKTSGEPTVGTMEVKVTDDWAN